MDQEDGFNLHKEKVLCHGLKVATGSGKKADSDSQSWL